MAPQATDMALASPTLIPLGDSALLVRFGNDLSEAANFAAIALARRLIADPLPGVVEVSPNLVSVLLRYDPMRTSFAELTGEVRLRTYSMGGAASASGSVARHRIAITFGGEAGPDLDAVAASLGLSAADFIKAHNAVPLRVLSTGFSPGFLYCGFHPAALVVSRRSDVRASVPAGSVLFAAGQTAIAATAIPTGWHLIGHTKLRNFNPHANPPTQVRAGDEVVFEAAP
ncbi:hypothetical protein VW29_15345 [Devosia limi DSM 17137]|uniref:Inhibitor of KinA n=1 Tax=Devosia limi DSM 17137 TaxID=1121477 RepID=A0A0F5LKY1_9HYPH|nr:allophanate hydrolase subunit 1 [Devosia limi]KKB82915.1 hypothetical protein VW29_15345 [Devosia limi DSM 17137]SHF51235.1 inhibitor of KinA [Devosia limi DSM 17137]